MTFKRWRSRGGTSPSGDGVIPTEVVLDEVLSFDRRLISMMEERVAWTQKYWSRPDVRIDMAQLVNEQRWREKALDKALSAAPKRMYEWDAVMDAIAAIERALARSSA